MEKEKIENIEIEKKIKEVFDYLVPGKMFKIKSKSISFYEYSSMLKFIKSLRNQTNNSNVATGLKILEYKDDCLLLLSVKIVDSNFKICDELDFNILNKFNPKLNHLRIYTEFLIGQEKGIKILRLYFNTEKAFFYVKNKISSHLDSKIEYQLYDGLDGEVIGEMFEEIINTGKDNE